MYKTKKSMYNDIIILLVKREEIMSTRRILFSWLVLLMSLGSLDASTEEDVFVIGVDPNILIQNIAGEEISIARTDSRRGDPNNLIRDAVTWHKVSVARKNPVRRGLNFILLKNNDVVGSMRIGVFADNKSAVEKFEEYLVYTSVGPDKDLSDELGNKAVGWGMNQVVFVRDNVAVAFNMRLDKLIPTGVSPDVVMTMAKGIDEALANGFHGVHRASVLRMPRISEVEVPKEIFAGTKTEVKIHITLPKDVNGDSEVGITRLLRYCTPTIESEGRKDVCYEITYVTPNCVVTSKQVVLTITNKGN